jgi:hypothetical protein
MRLKRAAGVVLLATAGAAASVAMPRILFPPAGPTFRHPPADTGPRIHGRTERLEGTVLTIDDLVKNTLVLRGADGRLKTLRLAPHTTIIRNGKVSTFPLMTRERVRIHFNPLTGVIDEVWVLPAAR